MPPPLFSHCALPFPSEPHHLHLWILKRLDGKNQRLTNREFGTKLIWYQKTRHNKIQNKSKPNEKYKTKTGTDYKHRKIH